MAKKSVGVVEMHLEKVVLGAAVLFLLVVVFQYLVSNPNFVVVDDNPMYADRIDEVASRRAEQLALRLQQGRPSQANELKRPTWVDTMNAAFDRGLIEVAGLDEQIVAAVPRGHRIKRIKVEAVQQTREGIALAHVLEPNAPRVRYVRTLAVPPRDPEAKGDEEETVLEEDINLVILETEFDLAEQRRTLEERHRYDEEFASVIFAAVEVQRQERLGPRWGEWEDVIAYTEFPPPEPPVLKLVGGEMLSQQSRNDFREYREKLLAGRAQADLLTPQGPTRRSRAPAYELTRTGASRRTVDVRDRRSTAGKKEERRSSVPRLKGDLSNYGRTTAKKRTVMTGRDKTTGKDGKDDKEDQTPKFSSDEEAQQYIAEKLAEAERLEEAREYTEAKAAARLVLAVHEKRKAGSQKQILRAQEILGRGEAGDRQGMGLTGAGSEPIHAFDVSGEPGRTYRYRMRVGILNEYCPAAGKLKDPNNATRPILYGEWSDPSEPVNIERDTYFYVARKDREAGLRVDVFKWYQDGWVKETFVVESGDEIGGKRGVQVSIGNEKYYEELDFFTGAVAVDLMLDTPYEDVQTRGDGYSLTQRSAQKTQVLVYMDEDGELHERLAMADKADPRYKELQKQTKAVRDKPVKVRKETKADKTKKRGSGFKKYGSRSSRSKGYGRSRRGSSGRSSHRGSSGRRR